MQAKLFNCQSDNKGFVDEGAKIREKDHKNEGERA
jgi:hypothetical protein